MLGTGASETQGCDFAFAGGQVAGCAWGVRDYVPGCDGDED